MQGRGRLSLLVILVPAGIVAALLLRNVFSEDRGVETLARARACDGRGNRCAPRMSRLIKTPLYHELRFTVGRDQRDVRCNRTLYLLGDYQCRVVAE